MLRQTLSVLMVVSCASTGTDAPCATQPVARLSACATADGYHGIWYANQATNDEFKFKYSGGLGTYCAKHIPMAIYAPGVEKTFFVYGGMSADGHLEPTRRTLLAMVSYYDHKTGQVPRPRILVDKKTSDAHDNPVISLDDKGHIWVFVAAHGTARPAYIYRSIEPYEINAFELVQETNFSYPQPWYLPGQGFLFCHTRYTKKGRELFAMTSPDGRDWSEPTHLAGIAKGHYQVSGRYKNKVGTAFNYHPEKGGLNHRTNLYYIETKDFGKNWRTVNNKRIELPLTEIDNKALVRDYTAYDRLVYLKDITFDNRGNPIILFVTSRGWQPGPKTGPRRWNTARWTGREWEVSGVLRYVDNNYDTGCLFIDKIDYWRLVAPTGPGPQPFNPGGEVATWVTDDLGRSWYQKPMTANSKLNHTYVRRVVDGHRDFEVIWADGHGRKPSESRLYFADTDGKVFRLPWHMETDFAKPEPVPAPVVKHRWLGPSRPAPDDTKPTLKF